MSDVACGYLLDDGTACQGVAVAYVQVAPSINVPACELHAHGAPVTPVEEE